MANGDTATQVAERKTADKEPDQAAGTNGRKPLLQINTLAPDRPFAEVDDVRHDFRLLQEFGPIEHQEFTRDSTRYDELWRQDEPLNAAAKKRMSSLLDRLVEQVLVDPAALTKQLGERLTGAIKRDLVLTFTNAPFLMSLAAARETEETESLSTTES